MITINGFTVYEGSDPCKLHDYSETLATELGTAFRLIREIIGTYTSTYSTSGNYTEGDVVVYQGKIYECLANTTGEWDDTKWSEISLRDEQDKQNEDIEELKTGKYAKPNGGIPKADLSSEVRTSLEKADTALQEHQDISGKEDSDNKIDTLSDQSTNDQYPSAKCVYDLIKLLKEVTGTFTTTYSTSESYEEGDIVVYEGKIYKCNADTSGTWDSTKWDEISLLDELNQLNSEALQIAEESEVEIYD